MIRLENVVHQAEALSVDERRQLIEILCAQLAAAHEDDPAVGQRGLAAWTESAQGEDWSAWYPPELRNGRGTAP